MQKDRTEIWTIYEYPIDYPDKYVARKFILDKPTQEIIIADTLEELRKKLPKGLIRLERSEYDDEKIVECWM